MAARTEEAKHSDKGHLHYSVALMLRFLFVARDGARQQSALELSGRVASLINCARDRQVAARRSSIVDAHSTSLLDTEGHESVEGIVDRPIELHEASDGANERANEISIAVLDENAPPQHGPMAAYIRAGEDGAKRPRVKALRHAG